MHDFKSMEVLYKGIGEKYEELKKEGFLVDQKTDHGDVFKSYIAQVKEMLDNEVLAWKDTLKEAKAKASEN